MFLRSLAASVTNSFRDPVLTAMKREDFQAAARYWRERIANAPLKRNAAILDTSLNESLTEEELDRFEHDMLNQIARSFVYAPKDNWLFQERGLDIGFYASCAASAAGVSNKIAYTGFFTRLRILPGKEVAFEHEPYRSQNWATVWSAAAS